MNYFVLYLYIYIYSEMFIDREMIHIILNKTREQD